MNKQQIIFGTGPLGYWVMKELIGKGNQVTMVNRSGKVAIELPDNVKIIAADATDPDAVSSLCKDAEVVYHCAMPPYTKWPEMFPPLMKGILEGVISTNAKLIFGDNLYMYGTTGGKPVHEDLPYAATGHKGKIRAQMAQMLLDAHMEGKVRISIGRGSDFFGPQVINSAFGEMFLKPAFAGKTVNLLGNIDLPHTLTYIKDFAKALVIMGEDDRALGKAWHVPNAEAITTRQIVKLMEKEIGKPVKIRTAGKLMVSVLGLFNPMLKEVKEMMYTWEEPYIVDSRNFEETFSVRSTSLEIAVQETVDWYRELAGR